MTKKSLLRILTSLFLLLLTVAPLLAQGDVEGGGEAAAEPEQQSVLQMIMHGGPLIMMIWLAILGTSITMVTFVIQNILTLRVEKLAPSALFDSLRNSIHAGNYQEAWETCSANNNYLANVVKAGLERLGRGRESVEAGLAEHALREAQVLRTRNSYLSVIGVVSPMIGLLGTVIGMMGAFAQLGTSGIGDPRGLASAIGEVLLATASGLFIAIPAFIAYYIFRNRSQMVIVYADDRVNSLMEDVPFEELRGIHIGQEFDAGAGQVGAPGAERSAKVSMALTTNCPICNGAITPGENPCPHCGATLDWSS